MIYIYIYMNRPNHVKSWLTSCIWHMSTVLFVSEVYLFVAFCSHDRVNQFMQDHRCKSYQIMTDVTFASELMGISKGHSAVASTQTHPAALDQRNGWRKYQLSIDVGDLRRLPSGKLTLCYWKWPFIVSLCSERFNAKSKFGGYPLV